MQTRRILSVLISSLIMPCAILEAAENLVPYLDTSLPQASRIDDLISRMTLEEKTSIMSNTTPGVPRLGIPKYNWWSEALHGVANAGNATVFPQAIGLAAMWDESLQYEIAGVIGIEGRAKFNGYVGTPEEGTLFHGLTFWSPNVNIFRDPRWGRGQETYGEDPFLTSRLGVAFVRGLQGNDPHYLLAAACAKHFAVHSGPEPLRHLFDATPSAEDLHDTYLPAFEALVREGKVEIAMTAYNAIDGIPSSVNPKLYDLLSKWGFDGHVTSDCGSVEDLSRTYKWAADDAEAGAMTIKAGMNVRCGWEADALPEAVRRGLITEVDIDKRLHPLLRTMFRLGFFDSKAEVPYHSIVPSQNDTSEHGALALRAAQESMVLLKNDGLLPLKTGAIHRVAVIGPNASSACVLEGNYNGTPSAPVTVLAGLKAALEPFGIKVDYAHGCDYSTRSNNWRLVPQPWFNGKYYNTPDFSGDPIERPERPICLECMAASSQLLPDGVADKNISICWNGDMWTTMGGDYRFRVRGRGGFRLVVNNHTIIDSLTPVSGMDDAERVLTGACLLPDNTSVPVCLEYVQGDGPVSLAFEWITPPVDKDAEALAIAKDADVIVYVGGISAQLEGEEMAVDYDGFDGGDRLDIELPELQRQLLEKLRETGKPIVMVNMSGSAVALPWADEHLNAILQAWYPGQAGGTAVADVLLGKYNPAGRLPVTFYGSTADLPGFEDYNMSGRTYKYFKGKPLYPFGYGLSYTKFDYARLHAVRTADGAFDITVDVKNTGDRDGDEVVQVYAVPPASSNPRESEALCGFSRTHLKAGESKTVHIVVPATALRRWNKEKNDYTIPGGEWTFRVGASSADIRQSVTLKL